MVTLEDSLTLRYRNHNLAKAISDVGWGMFTNFLADKQELKGGKLVEIDRWFPSSKAFPRERGNRLRALAHWR